MTAAAETAGDAVCSSRIDVGDCGQAPLYKDDGTPCPTAWGATTNTCNQLSGGGALITSCATVTTFHPEYAGRGVDTGWFTTLDECCLGGRKAGAGVHWGETKICCQVAEGQSPAGCETPCGIGGMKGCASCTPAASGGVGGSCTIATAPVDNNDCQGDVGQFSETITIQSADAACVSDASLDDNDVQ
jgi:hypothetical protein